jgi:hypothetical protein
MSKTTKKYGNPLYTLHLRVEATVEPSNALLRNWIKLDYFAEQVYNKPYHALTNKQKTELHIGINTGVLKDEQTK